MVDLQSIEPSVAEILNLYGCRDCKLIDFILIKDIHRFFKFIFDKKGIKFAVILPSSNKELEKTIKDIGKDKVNIFYSVNLKESSFVICFCNS